mmetsp:Transcript_22085/g.41725  ORF Transcript_22085/g.41725 Transcript_22085/m.41725 type:complete len:939 (-) Transcript_22085:304-3120(-)
MPTPAHLPLASNSNIVTDRGDNDGGSDYDEEEGEPPSIPPFDDDVLSTSTKSTLLIELPVVMTAGHLPQRPSKVVKIHRADGNRRRRRCRVGNSPWFAAAVLPSSSLVAIILCLCTSSSSCAAENYDPLNHIISSANNNDDAAPREIIPNVVRMTTTTTEESRGLRGGLGVVIHADDDYAFSEDSMVSPSENCNYECCSSFFHVISQNNDKYGTDFAAAQSESSYQLSGTKSGMRMLQEESSNMTNPCPADNSTGKDKSEEGGIGIPVPAQYILIVILVMFSALFSGLTLGLMSLDPSGLEIVMANSDDPDMARAAKAIYPVRLNGNLLLCTLLLGNVGVNSLLSILMADLTSGLVGFVVSTCVIVIFGEIIPQAICSRFALQVGEKTVPLVKFIMVLLYPVCKPMSMILNKVLGHEIGTTYSTSEMAKLIEMHVQRGDLEGATGAAMTGALQYRSVSVEEVMTPLDNTFMLSADERLGFDTVAKIFKTGYSRIPVYEVSMSNIIGLLFVKDLIFLDPEDEIPVKNFVQIFGRGLHVVWPDDKLGDVLKLLKHGRSHMALVRGVNEGDGKMDPFYEIKGIITLEDIIEIILGDEIVDETDELVDVNDPDSVVRRPDMGDYIEGALERSEDSHLVGGGASDVGSSRAIDWEARLRLLDERLVDEHLSSDEVRAVAAHLKTNYSRAVELISDRQLKEVLSSVPVTEISPAYTCATDDGGDGSGVPTDSSELIYKRGVSAEFCTVVLSGKIMVMSGADKFRSDVSNWGVLASRALTDPSYIPDFSAWVVPNQNSSGGCRCVKLDRMSYGHAVDNTALEKADRNVDHAPPAVSMRAVITNVPASVPNRSTGNSSQCRREVGSTLTSALDNLTQKKAGSTKQIDKLLNPRKNSLPPQTPDNTVQLVNAQRSPYVRTDTQKKTHSRRSKLLKAFSRAERDVGKK